MFSLFDRQFTHDPEYFHEPEKFKPERFLGVDGREPEMDTHTLSFGFGRRYVLWSPSTVTINANGHLSLSLFLSFFMFFFASMSSP